MEFTPRNLGVGDKLFMRMGDRAFGTERLTIGHVTRVTKTQADVSYRSSGRDMVTKYRIASQCASLYGKITGGDEDHEWVEHASAERFRSKDRVMLYDYEKHHPLIMQYRVNVWFNKFIRTKVSDEQKRAVYEAIVKMEKETADEA